MLSTQAWCTFIFVAVVSFLLSKSLLLSLARVFDAFEILHFISGSRDELAAIIEKGKEIYLLPLVAGCQYRVQVVQVCSAP